MLFIKRYIKKTDNIRIMKHIRIFAIVILMLAATVSVNAAVKEAAAVTFVVQLPPRPPRPRPCRISILAAAAGLLCTTGFIIAGVYHRRAAIHLPPPPPRPPLPF